MWWIKIQIWFWELILDEVIKDGVSGRIDQYRYYETSTRIQQRLSALGKELNN